MNILKRIKLLFSKEKSYNIDFGNNGKPPRDYLPVEGKPGLYARKRKVFVGSYSVVTFDLWRDMEAYSKTDRYKEQMEGIRKIRLGK